MKFANVTRTWSTKEMWSFCLSHSIILDEFVQGKPHAKNCKNRRKQKNYKYAKAQVLEEQPWPAPGSICTLPTSVWRSPSSKGIASQEGCRSPCLWPSPANPPTQPSKSWAWCEAHFLKQEKSNKWKKGKTFRRDTLRQVHGASAIVVLSLQISAWGGYWIKKQKIPAIPHQELHQRIFKDWNPRYSKQQLLLPLSSAQVAVLICSLLLPLPSFWALPLVAGRFDLSFLGQFQKQLDQHGKNKLEALKKSKLLFWCQTPEVGGGDVIELKDWALMDPGTAVTG